MPTKMALVVRTDLGLGKGKIAAQAAHTAVSAMLVSTDTAVTDAWLAEGQSKVVLRVPNAEVLQQVWSDAVAAGITAKVVEDAGRTQIPAGTLTCCAIGPAPASEVDAITGGLSLL